MKHEQSDVASMIHEIEKLTGGKVSIKTPEDKKKVEQVMDSKKYDAVNASTQKEFVRMKTDAVKEVVNKMSLTGTLKTQELGALGKLVTHMQLGKNGLLMYEGERMLPRDMQEIFGLSKTPTTTIIKSLVDSGVLRREGNVQSVKYFINSSFFSMDAGETEWFVKVYKVALREIASNLTLAELGFFYKLLMFMHYSDLTLCENPTVGDVSEIKRLHRHADIARMTGESKATVMRYMNRLNTLFLVSEFKIGGVTTFIINPEFALQDSTLEGKARITEFWNHFAQIALQQNQNQQEETQ